MSHDPANDTLKHRFFTNTEGLWLAKAGPRSSVIPIAEPNDIEDVKEAMARFLEHEDFGE